MKSYKKIRKSIKNCEKCELHKGCDGPVPGNGALDTDLMIIGQNPGYQEDKIGVPFIGDAGQLLDKMLEAIGYKDFDYYKTNVVKCKTEGNRIPFDKEAKTCLPFLDEEIELIKPTVIVLLGGFALYQVLGKSGIHHHRGTWYKYKDILTMPTFHPAYLLRDKNQKGKAWTDFQHIQNMLNKRRV